MQRNILHINIANFIATIEEISDAALRGEPFVVALPFVKRSVILDVSRAAFAEGLRKNHSLKMVHKMRGIKIIEPRYDLYSLVARKISKLVQNFAPVVEELTGGHLFLDISGTKKIFGHPLDHAARLKREISERLGISPIIGLATNRLVSKVATRVVKPDGFAAVAPGDEESFLCNQEVSLLPGIGEKLEARLNMLGIKKAGELAALKDVPLSSAFGKRGVKLRALARGIDFTPIVASSLQNRNLRTERSFTPDIVDSKSLEINLLEMTEELGFKLRQNNLLAGRITLEIYYTDGKANNESLKLQQAPLCDYDLFKSCRDLLAKIFSRRVRVRKMVLIFAILGESGRQLDLFVPEKSLKMKQLQQSVDQIRIRFGKGAVRYASAVPF